MAFMIGTEWSMNTFSTTSSPPTGPEKLTTPAMPIPGANGCAYVGSFAVTATRLEMWPPAEKPESTTRFRFMG